MEWPRSYRPGLFYSTFCIPALDTDGLTEDEVREEIEIREAELDLIEEAEAWLGIVADVEGL